MLPDDVIVVLVPKGRTSLQVPRCPSPEPVRSWVCHDSPPPLSSFETHIDAVELRPFFNGSCTVHAALHRGRLYVSMDTRHVDLSEVYAALVALQVAGATQPDHSDAPAFPAARRPPDRRDGSVQTLNGEPAYWCAFCQGWFRYGTGRRPTCLCRFYDARWSRPPQT